MIGHRAARALVCCGVVALALEACTLPIGHVGAPTKPPLPPVTPSIPDVTGMAFPDAKAKLNDMGYRVIKRPDGLSGDAGGLVSIQDPTAGSEGENGSLIKLWVPRKGVAVPLLFDLRSARSEVRDLGLRLKVKRVVSELSILGPVVLSQSPAAGTVVAPGKLVTITVAKTGGEDCPPGSTPGYSPCLPAGQGDYDCSYSANGPNYTAPGVVYRVTGLDPYDLDRDGNGSGCE